MYKVAWLKTSSTAVQRTKDLLGWSADCLCLSASLTDFRAETQLKVLRGAASILELLELALVLKNHGSCLIAITPASIAYLAEGEVQVDTRDTDPVTDALSIRFHLLCLEEVLANLWLLFSC